MNRKQFSQVLVTGCILILSLTMMPTRIVSAQIEEYQEVSINARSLGPGYFYNDNSQYAWVFLPEDYNEQEESKYPVIYFIPGYDLDIYTTLETLNYLYYSQSYTDAITVVCYSNINGIPSIPFINSDLLGYWEDYLAQDVVSFMDENYRTIASASARAVITHDFFSFAISNPNVIDTVYGYNMNINDPNSPNLNFHEQSGVIKIVLDFLEDMKVDLEGLSETEEIQQVFFDAINAIRDDANFEIERSIASLLFSTGLAIAPNLSNPCAYMDFPYYDNGTAFVEIPDVKEIWDIGLFDINSTVEENQEIFASLNIGVLYSEDYFPQLKCWESGNKLLCDVFDSLEIEYQRDIMGNPIMDRRALVRDNAFPFCTQHMDAKIEDTGNTSITESIPGYPFIGIGFGFICIIVLYNVLKRKTLLNF